MRRTDKQKAASRANGARSRGPVTPEGKARSARKDPNQTLAKAVVLKGESRFLFNKLLETFTQALKPEHDFDRLLVGRMAAAHWRQMRQWRLEVEGRKPASEVEMNLDRQFFRTFAHYQRMKMASEPRKSLNPNENG